MAGVGMVEVGLGDVARILLYRWRTVLLSVVVTTALAVGAFYALPPQYSATTTLVVSPLVNNPSENVSARDSINIATEREILLSSDVARLALESLGQDPDDAEDLISRMSVVAPDNSQVLRITVDDDDPSAAADATNALAQAYLEFRREGGEDMAERFMEQIDERVAELSDEQGNAATRDQVSLLLDERRALTLFGQDPGRIIGQASPPTSSSGPGLLVFVAAGLVGGGLLSVGIALLRERTDRRVRSGGRLAATVGESVVIVDDVHDIESVRWLRRSVASVVCDNGVVLVLSVGSGEVGLAEALTRTAREAGQDVLLEDAADLTPAEVDRWTAPVRGSAAHPSTPSGDAGHSGLIVMDATGVDSPTSLSELAGRAEAAVLVVAPRDSLQAVRALYDLIAETQSTVLPVFLKHRGRRQGGRA